MSVLQKVRLIAGERLDIPDIARISEFACSDWGQFFNKFWSDSPYIIKGFEIDNPRAYIGLLTSQGLEIEVANSVMFYGNATYGGAFYVAPATAAQSTSLTANSTNYVEFEFTISTGTPDTRKIWDADGKAEFDQIIDTVQYLDIIVTSNTIGFTTGRIPIAKVVCNASSPSTITQITDCRELMFRLGTGGATPVPLNSFTWPDVPVGYSRTDQPVAISGVSPLTSNPFKGSDKNIRNLKEWMDAVMTRIKEISGDAYWFMSGGGGGGAGANVADLWWDAVGSKMTGTGTFAHSPAGTLTWNSTLYIQGIVGPYNFQIPAAAVALADDEVAYLIQTRNQSLPAGNPVDFYFGMNYVNSTSDVIGNFTGLVAGDYIKNTVDGIDYYCKILTFQAAWNGGGAAVTAANAKSVTISPVYKGVDASGTTGVYARGSYSVGGGDIIVAARSAVPNSANVWWLAMREDNGGGSALIYLRDGHELQIGESIEISDETSEQLISYIGAPNEATAAPTYADAAALVGSKAAVQNYSCVATDNLTVRDSKLTSMMADKAQDKTISIREGGRFNWDLATSTLSWTEPIVISIPSSTFNETIAAGNQVIAAGECIYFTIDRNAGAVDIRAKAVALEKNVTLDEYTFILAKRGADDNIYMMDGTVFLNDQPDILGSKSVWYYDATLWGCIDDNITDNSIPLGLLIDHILASYNYQAVIYFPAGTPAANYYKFSTTLTKNLANYQILITGSPVGKGSANGGGLTTAFNFDVVGNGWEFSNGTVSLDSIVFIGGTASPANLIAIKLTTCSGGFIHDCYFNFNYIDHLSLIACNHLQFDLNTFLAGTNTTGKLIDLSQCSWIDINNINVDGGLVSGGDIGINVGYNCSNIVIDGVYGYNLPSGVIYISDMAKIVACRNLNLFAQGQLCKGIIIDTASDVVIDNIYTNLLDTFDIELYNRPMNVSIRNYRTEKAGYTGINDITGITLLGNSTDQPSIFPYMKGVTNRGADIVSGTVGVKAIGKLVFTDKSLLAETLTINAVAHTYVATGTSNPNEIRISSQAGPAATDAASAALRTAFYFNRNSTQKDKVWAWNDGVDTVYFYAKDPGVAANAYTFTDTLTNATIPGATGFMNNQQVGVDPINTFTVDDATGNVTTDGDITVDGSSVIAGAQTLGRTNASLAMAIATANALQTVLLAHYNDGAEHFNGGGATPDTVQAAALTLIPVASNLATLRTLVTGEQVTYTAHDTDAKLALPVYHNAQYAGSDLILGAPGTLATCIAALDEIIVKYSTAIASHDKDNVAHSIGNTHPITTALLYSYSSTPIDYVIGIYDTSKVVDVVLSTADCLDGRTIIVKDFSGGATAMNITVSGEGGELIDGLASQPIAANWNSFTLVSDSVAWYLI
jgi:hypothetical protein